MNILPKAVIFDMDGVIFNTEQVYLDSCVQAAKDLGKDNIREAFIGCIGVSEPRTREILSDACGSGFDFEGFWKNARAIADEKLRDGYPLKSGAAELLRWLNDNNVPVALASSTATRSVVKALMKAGIIHYFSNIVGGDMVKKGKPDPEIYLTAAALLKTEPENCLVLEDSPAGIRAAHDAGMKVIMIPDLIEPDESIKAMTKAVLPSLDSVRSYLSVG